MQMSVSARLTHFDENIFCANLDTVVLIVDCYEDEKKKKC